jgi:hypothetical protein
VKLEKRKALLLCLEHSMENGEKVEEKRLKIYLADKK